MQAPLVYRRSPLLGIDIGSHSAKIVQLHHSSKTIEVLGYVSINFPPELVVEGIVVDPDAMAKAIAPAFASKGMKFSAKRVATALPVSKVFTRVLQLPAMEKADLEEAIRLEAEQSIPVPATDLVMDHEIIGSSHTVKGEAQTDVLMVAAPRAIVDSYVKLFNALHLEIAAVEITLMAIARALVTAGGYPTPALIVDFGSTSADLAVYDQVIRLTGTTSGGGDQITAALVKNLGVTPEQANEIKIKFGIGPSGLQPKVIEALNPLLKSLITEMKKAIKYYQDRNPGKQIKSVVVTGGSANVPGLINYLNQNLGLELSVMNPWTNLKLKHLKPPPGLESSLYSTAIGLALAEVSND